MSGQIIINYRREDGSTWAERLYDRLQIRFPKNQIFIDVDNLDPGIDFVEAIEQSVGSGDVLIAVIGKRWLISSEAEGSRRLDNPDDFVRLEIATALKRNIRVIPVLVDDASMPRASDLPDDLKSLVRRQAIPVSHDRFSADSERLIAALDLVFQKTAAEQREREEKARLEAELKERLEAERQQKEKMDRLEAERREHENKERLEAEQHAWFEVKRRQQIKREQKAAASRRRALARPPLVVASSKPTLTGAGSSFNLAGTYFDDEPIIGFLKPGSTSFEEAMGLSADCLDQAERSLLEAERILLQADAMMDRLAARADQ
jgi:hypothetical protein